MKNLLIKLGLKKDYSSQYAETFDLLCEKLSENNVDRSKTMHLNLFLHNLDAKYFNCKY
jgi:hypothetical protein